jgi:hypothetical protein
MRPQTIRRPRSATLHEIEPVNKLFFQKGYDVVKQIDRTIMLRTGERIGPFNARQLRQSVVRDMACTIILKGFTAPKGVLHSTRAPEKSAILMVETAAIVPTGDA